MEADTAPRMARLEVDRFTAGTRRTTVVYFELDVPEPVRAVATPVLEDILVRLQEETGLTRRDAACVLMCEIAERGADAEGYEREAARRGLLAL